MPISSIAQILLCLFALTWVLYGLIIIIGFMIAKGSEMELLFSLLPSAFHLVAGIFLWIFSSRISRLVARGDDGKVDLVGIKEEHLYAAVSIGLGLFFVLESLGDVFRHIHQVMMLRSLAEEHVQDLGQVPLQNLLQSGLTLVAGIALVMTARTWSRKIVRSNLDA